LSEGHFGELQQKKLMTFFNHDSNSQKRRCKLAQNELGQAEELDFALIHHTPQFQNQLLAPRELMEVL
jgi:hypothetical protein